jgi:two-component system, chemotaxis family, protein-glutamate methylesterase/glutaminase
MTSGRDMVVMAASAGGLQPLREMLRCLPADLPASVHVVLHVPATGGRSLPGILDRAGPLPAASAVDGERIQPGRVYVAPPDRHLLVIKDTIRLSRGPRQNGLRPAADPLFRSAALYAGQRTTAVVLSGTLDDASLGSATVERRGGRVLVQDPAEADYDSMPRGAIAATERAVVGSTRSLAAEVVRLASEALEPRDIPAPDQELTNEIGELLAGNPETNTQTRKYSDLTCPECGGPLYRAHEVGTETYDCLVGHRWSPQSLFEEHSASVERALWLAIRSLEERGRLSARLASSARTRGHPLSAEQFSEAAEEARRSADTIREVAEDMMIAEVAPGTAGA